MIGAIAGATLGYTPDELTVGAPLSSLLVGFATGLLAGRRSLAVSFTAGAIAAGVFGTKLDTMLGQERRPSSTSSLHSSA
jgi:hypothetical protein